MKKRYRYRVTILRVLEAPVGNTGLEPNPAELETTRIFELEVKRPPDLTAITDLLTSGRAK